MATASRFSSRRINAIGVLAVVLLAGVVYLVGRDDTPSREPRTSPDVVVVTSDSRHRFTELAQLVAASDLVVSGRVVAVEPGRTFGAVDAHGDAAPNAIRSQVRHPRGARRHRRESRGARAGPRHRGPGRGGGDVARPHPDRGRRRARDEGGRRGDLVPDRVAGP